MDLVLRNARVGGRPAGEETVDIAIAEGRIADIGPAIAADAPVLDVAGRLVAPGFVETHIHLDKACILDRCRMERGDLDEAIAQAAAAKRAFTEEDVAARARQVLDLCIAHGTQRMRTHVELDPGIGMRGFDGIRPLIDEYRWAIDVEICVFPQEGLLNNPGTDQLLVQGLERGARAIGAAPYTDSDPKGQIDRIFELAREFDVDIDMHLDFGETPEGMDLDYVCELTERYRWGGRVTVGHVTKLSCADPARFEDAARRLRDSGVSVTVLPATDLYLMGRGDRFNVRRGVVPVHRLNAAGVRCSLATNNVLNPFTPFGDCSLLRMANLYANISHAGGREDMRRCFDMISRLPAAILGNSDHALTPGKPADFIVIDAPDGETAVARIAEPLYGFKNGRTTFRRPAVELLRA